MLSLSLCPSWSQIGISRQDLEGILKALVELGHMCGPLDMVVNLLVIRVPGLVAC